MVLKTSFGTGYQRSLQLTGCAAANVTVRSPSIEGATVLTKGGELETWQVVRPAQGPPIWVEMYASQGTVQDIGRGQLEATLSLKPGSKGDGIMLSTLVLVDWNDIVRKQFEQWHRR